MTLTQNLTRKLAAERPLFIVPTLTSSSSQLQKCKRPYAQPLVFAQQSRLAAGQSNLQALALGPSSSGPSSVRSIYHLGRNTSTIVLYIAKRYTVEHETVVFDDSTGIGTISITDHAQSVLGDVVFVELPSLGTEVAKGGM